MATYICTKRWIKHMGHITCVVLNHHLLMKIVSIFAGTGSGLHCPKILISTYAFFSEMCNSGLGSGVQYSGCRDNKWGKFFKIALIRTKPGLHEITYSIIVFWISVTGDHSLLFSILRSQSEYRSQGIIVSQLTPSGPSSLFNFHNIVLGLTW